MLLHVFGILQNCESVQKYFNFKVMPRVFRETYISHKMFDIFGWVLLLLPSPFACCQYVDLLFTCMWDVGGFFSQQTNITQATKYIEATWVGKD